MSYHERRAIVSIISTILINATYFGYMSQRYPDASDFSPEVFQFWGQAILILIPVSVVAKIIITIVFSIINTVATNEGEPSFMDERDKVIELKSVRIGLYLFALGFIAAMAAVALKQPPATMFIILLSGGLLSDVISDFAQFYYYRRGA